MSGLFAICLKVVGESGLESAFNHSWSYHRLQVGFGGVCRCMRGDFNVDLSGLGRTIYARQLFLGAKPPIQFRHRLAEMNHSDHLY